MERKLCKGCGEVQPLVDFYPWSHPKAVLGVSSLCRTCLRQYQSKRMTDPETRIKRLVRGARDRAIASGLDFDPDPSDLLPAPTHCPVFNVPLDYRMGMGFLDHAPSIDRIDNSRGYVKGNRIIVSRLANSIKSSATPEQIIAVGEFYRRLR